MKKKCFAALSGLFLAISIIAPFSFANIKADTYISYPTLNQIVSFGTTDEGTYVVIDVYFISDYAISNNYDTIDDDDKCYFTINNNFSVTGAGWSMALIDADGVCQAITAQTQSGSGDNLARKYTITFVMENCSYFHYQIINRNFSYWTSTTISNMGSLMGIVKSVGTFVKGDYVNTNYNVALILQELQNLSSGGLTVDTSDVETLLDNISVNQETMIELLTEIRDGSTEASTSVENNDTQNSTGEEVITEYDTLTSTFESDFTDSQTEMTEILDNTSLTQFAAAAVWFTYQLGYLYDSLGDMKILVALPLILGIALFFIGRGNVIFRDPNTQIWNETYIHDTYADGSESFSKRSTISYNKKNKTKVKPKYF